MTNLEMLRVLVNERLTAAADEIFGLFAQTVGEYEDQLYRLKQENERQSKLLHVVFTPEVRLNRKDAELDENPQRIKEEKEQPSSSWEGGLFNSVDAEKSEDVKKEEAHSSLLYQGQPEEESPANCLAEARMVEDLEGSETVCNSDPDSLLQTTNNTVVICEQADSSYFDCNGIRETQAELKLLNSTGVSVFENERNADIERVICAECGKTFDVVQNYMQNPSGKFVCAVCFQESTESSHFFIEKETYAGTKIFICAVCKKQFNTKSYTMRHIRIHMGERPFSCSVCHKQFTHRSLLIGHLRVHTGEKPYTCSVCNTSFSLSYSLTKHMRIHTGEKPFGCTVCGKRFTQKGHLTQHMPLHTGERLYSCHVCGKSFSRQSGVKKHKCVEING
ncbi:zinc finger protein OZF-like [Betta splendens]|uniref:Zinc finger protein OZF-like n=1 Tax=Betta splendens TaxID=158456 RepID=A0A6P7MQM6_BETSP|nr:zinc finger protein OZF-like [Betta splendens]